MAYNLESIVKILEQILQPNHCHNGVLDPGKKPEIESLLEKARFLKKFFENFSIVRNNDKIESLENRIRDASHEVEDILESHLADQIRSIRKGESITISPQGLQRVIEEFDSAVEDIKKIVDGSHQLLNKSLPAGTPVADPNPKNILVGVDEDSTQLMDRLTGQKPELEIIAIVGMGGIGKTTFARNVYDLPLVIHHFDIRAWITISQHNHKDENNLRRILLGLLSCALEKLTDKVLQDENDKLALHLHKSLVGRRYLIVLDDMWVTDDWDDIKRFLPDEKNGSRIIVTTRETDVANYAASSSSHHQMQPLNKDDSWNLLRQKVFAPETCPPELEEIGRRIAKSCGGLPLAVHVVGGVLAQGKRTLESWAQVARDVSSIMADKDEQFSKVLSLSYNYLPCHLKPCFLYMGAFPEDHEIRGSKLIRLWVAEGFLKPIPEKSLEEAADMYLKALVDRNLISVRQRETNGILKSYSIHDLLRDLCVRKASQEKFLFAMNWQVSNIPEETICLHRVSAHSSDHIKHVYKSRQLMTRTRSFLLTGAASRKILCPVIFRLQLLKVLDIFGKFFPDFPEEVLQLVNLRYLAFKCRSALPSSISALGNLQTIIFKNEERIWERGTIFKLFEMPRLRHIRFKEKFTFYKHPNGKRFALQESLQSLSTIELWFGSVQLLASLPNLKKLGVYCYYSLYSNLDLSCLPKLETFKCSSNRNSFFCISYFIFPPSLRKVTLCDCKISPRHLNQIADLPNLQVFKVRLCIFESQSWEPVVGQFSRLQLLHLEMIDLEDWIAEETNFPRLERLVIRDCSELEEIPIAIGDISTLETIEVHRCCTSLVASARKIHEEQLELANDGLQVRITR